MKFWIIGELFFQIFFCYLLADFNYDITHNFVYSALIMVVSGAVVYSLFSVKFKASKTVKYTEDVSSTFKQYSAKKKRWYKKYSYKTIVFFTWISLILLLIITDKYFHYDEKVIAGLPVIESGTTSTGKSRVDFVVVADNDRLITCRGHYNHILEKKQQVTVSLFYSNTLSGFERTNCKLDVVYE